ncbi:hypothetical protein FRC06_004375 [Ceratobasidium sp. 370]|nr:hypothetical protein FRC06_004375 [Ceratobasidium sp. 370]
MPNVQSHPPRNIIVLCDGTGKNGQHDSTKGEPITNIWRLYRAIQPREGDIVKYFPGVGAYNDGIVADLLAKTFGHTVVVSIREIYMTIAQNYKDGDSISLFGYSRGAFIVRKVASLIGALGLIADEAKFNEYWEGLEHKLPGNRSSLRPLKPRVVPITSLPRSLGYSVRPRAIREVLNLLTLPDDDLPEIVQLALHVVAYHENRKLFDVVLFDDNNSDKQLCKQTLFPGCHSDVGGGGDEPKRGRNMLPDVTLDWMRRNMPQTIQVAFGGKLESQVPSWYTLSSAFHDSPFWKRIPDKLHQRKYLPTRYGLLRHRTLLGLPSPDSPHLLKHVWRNWEHFDSPEEEANGPPAVKQSLIRRITDKAKSNLTPTWERPVLPSPSELPALSCDVHRAEPPVPQQYRPSTRSRFDSNTTDQTDFTINTPDTVSTARTSLASTDIPPEMRAWLLADAPESPASNSVRRSLLPIAEDAHPTTEKTEKPKFGTEGGLPTPPETPKRVEPVIGKPARAEPAARVGPAAQGRLGAQVHPAPGQTRPSHVPLTPTQGCLYPTQVPPARVPILARPGPAQVSISPTAQARPGPAQAGPDAPAALAPTRAGPSHVQVGPGPVQAYSSIAQVGPGILTSRVPAQAGPATPASPAAQADPAPVQAYPSAAPARPAVQPVPALQFPTAAQVYPTTPVGPSVRSRYSAPAYSPDIQARLADIQSRSIVQAPPAQIRPRQKKGVMRKIMAFFCCGMIG